MNESIKLEFREGSSDKIYNAELTEHGGGYVVNFAYGRRGTALTTGTKTYTPVSYDEGKRLYDALVRSKTSKGYRAAGGIISPINTTVRKTTSLRPQLLNELSEDDAQQYIEDDSYCMQEKHDGERRMIQYTTAKLTGSNKLGFETALTTETEDDCKQLSEPCILDGEDLGSKIVLFDEVLYPGVRYKERLAKLATLIPLTSKTLVVCKTAFTTEEKTTMWKELKETKAEGVVFKKIDAPYTPGRPASGGTQLKCKFYESASCIVTEHNQNKRSIGVSVLDANMNPLFVGNVTVYPNQDIPPRGSIVEIKYLYYFKEGSLYQPVLLGVRNDVTLHECLLSKLKIRRETD
jgi:bifunctional non-homologous end joining protein LigD